MNPILAERPDPRLVLILRRVAIVGAALVVVVPAARGYNTWLGAMPLWLLAMPLASLWALHGFRLRASGPVAAAQSPAARRRSRPQARRRRQYPASSRAFAASARPSSISSAARQNS